MERVSCRIPVFAPVMDKGNASEVEAWRNAVLSVTSPMNKEGVDFYIDRARDNIGAYKEGEKYPVNTSQLVVSTRSENPALAMMRIHSLNWANYTRPRKVEVIYEEKVGADLNVTVSVGKLCTRLSCPEQEMAVNPKSTFIFSPAVKERIDRGRMESNMPTLYNGYKRYVGEVSIPYAEEQLINSCAAFSLPGAEAGIESGDSSYNVDTDAFTVNMYFDQVSNKSRAVKVGDHIGFITIEFTTVFSDYMGPTNSILLANHIKHIYLGIQTESECRCVAHTNNEDSYDHSTVPTEMKKKYTMDMVSSRPCQLLVKGSEVVNTEAMLRVPLTGGKFAYTERPAKRVAPGGKAMRDAFVREWKKRNDPKYEQWMKAEKKVRQHREALRHIKDEMREEMEDDGFRMLAGEENTHMQKVEKHRQRMRMIMQADLRHTLTQHAIEHYELTSNTACQSVRPGIAISSDYDAALEVMERINKNEIKAKAEYQKAKMEFEVSGETKTVNIDAAYSPMGLFSMGEALFSTGDNDVQSEVHTALNTYMMLPATFVKDGDSAAVCGNCILSNMAKLQVDGKVEYDNPKQKIEVEIELGKKYVIDPVGEAPLLNIFSPLYSLTEAPEGKRSTWLALCAVNSSNIYQEGKFGVVRGMAGKKEEEKKQRRSIVDAYKGMKGEKKKERKEGQFTSTYISEDIATSVNRTPVAKVNQLTTAMEYIMAPDFTLESRYITTNANKTSIDGLLSMNMALRGRAIGCVLFHCKDSTDKWWKPTGNINRGTAVGDTGLTLGDIFPSAHCTTNCQILASPVPVYDPLFSRRAVRLLPIGDSISDQVADMAFFPLGDAKVTVTVEGIPEEREGGVAVVFVSYSSVSPNYTTLLPNSFPDNNGNLKPIAKSDSIYLYHFISNNMTVTDAPVTKIDDIDSGSTFGFCVLEKIPEDFPNLGSLTSAGIGIDESYVTYNSFSSNVANYNS